VRTRLSTLLLLVLAAGCSDLPAGNARLLLGWTFIDGRRCADSGVERVVLSRAGQYVGLAVAYCTEGFERPWMEVSLPGGEHRLELTALSPSETPLYRATFEVDLWPGTALDRVVALAFIGGI